MRKARSHKAGKTQKHRESANSHWLLIVLVLLAALVILMRMLEFSGHHMRHGAG